MAATLKVLKQSRSWKLKDSTDSEDLENLFESGNISYTKPVTCNKYWTFYLCLFGVFALFLFGIVVGFYLRADPKVFSSCVQSARRKDGFDREKLQAVHNNIMYYMSGDRFAKYNREFLSLSKPIADGTWEKQVAGYIKKQFQKFKFDKVKVEEHQVVITSPDPHKPNTLELLTLDGSNRRNGSSFKDQTKTRKRWTFTKEDQRAGFVTYSSSGNVVGPVHYGNEGTWVDLLQLQKDNISTNGSVLLLQTGGITIAEKVKNAEKFGAVGVLLFCNRDNKTFFGDCDSEKTCATEADIQARKDNQYPRIPVQTVSLEVALSILNRLDGTSLKNVSFVDFKNRKSNKNESSGLQVRLEVNNQKISRTIYNVIGTIHGSDEIDREIIVGTGNQLLNQSTWGTSWTNLAMLLELAKSLTFIKNTQGWRPRRTVRFAFWGGEGAGLVKHLKNHKHILEEQGVAYLGLDLAQYGQKYMQIETSPGLVSMVTKAALMVPDPGNPDISLADRWPELSHDWYLTNQYPVHNYRKASWYPFLEEIGLTSLVIKAVQYDKDPNNFLSGESTHHFKYHLAAARVVSHMLSQLTDDPKLPFDVEFHLQFVIKSVNNTINRLRQFMDFPESKTEPLLAIINKLAVAQQSLTLDLPRNTCTTGLQLRRFNDVVRRLDSVFVDIIPTQRNRNYLLTSDTKTGTLSVLLDAVNSYLLTGNSDIVYRTLSELTHSLEQAYTEIDTLLKEIVP